MSKEKNSFTSNESDEYKINSNDKKDSSNITITNYLQKNYTRQNKNLYLNLMTYNTRDFFKNSSDKSKNDYKNPLSKNSKENLFNLETFQSNYNPKNIKNNSSSILNNDSSRNNEKNYKINTEDNFLSFRSSSFMRELSDRPYILNNSNSKNSLTLQNNSDKLYLSKTKKILIEKYRNTLKDNLFKNLTHKNPKSNIFFNSKQKDKFKLKKNKSKQKEDISINIPNVPKKISSYNTNDKRRFSTRFEEFFCDKGENTNKKLNKIRTSEDYKKKKMNIRQKDKNFFNDINIFKKESFEDDLDTICYKNKLMLNIKNDLFNKNEKENLFNYFENQDNKKETNQIEMKVISENLNKIKNKMFIENYVKDDISNQSFENHDENINKKINFSQDKINSVERLGSYNKSSKKSFELLEIPSIDTPFDNDHNRYEKEEVFEIEKSSKKKKKKLEKFRVLSKVNKIYDSLSDNELRLDFMYFVLNPNCIPLILLDFIIFIIMFLSVIFTPLLLVFYNFYKSYLLYPELAVDIIMMIDFLLNFITGFFDFEENYNPNIKRIFYNYIKSYFFIDFIALIPFNSIHEYINYSETYENKIYNDSQDANISEIMLYNNRNLFRLVKIIRLIKCVKIINNNKFLCYLSKNFSNQYSLPFKIKAFLLYLYFTLISHVLTCIFIYLGTIDNTNWITNYRLDNSKFLDIYFASLYFNHLTIFTIGYGDIVSKNSYERLYNILLMVFGVMLYSFVLSWISNVFIQENEKTKKYDLKRCYFNRISEKYNISNDLYNKISTHLRHEMKNFKTDREILYSELPNSLKNDLILNIFKKIRVSFNFLKFSSNTDFIINVLMVLKPTKYKKDEIILNEDDLIEEMLIVKNGILSLEKSIKFFLPDYLEEDNQNIIPNQEILILKILNLRKNDHFGDSLMIQNKRSPISLRVKSFYAELLLMPKIELIKISTKFPDTINKIFKKSEFNIKQITNTIDRSEKIIRDNNTILINQKLKGNRKRITLPIDIKKISDYEMNLSRTSRENTSLLNKNNNIQIEDTKICPKNYGKNSQLVTKLPFTLTDIKETGYFISKKDNVNSKISNNKFDEQSGPIKNNFYTKNISEDESNLFNPLLSNNNLNNDSYSEIKISENGSKIIKNDTKGDDIQIIDTKNNDYSNSNQTTVNNNLIIFDNVKNIKNILYDDNFTESSYHSNHSSVYINNDNNDNEFISTRNKELPLVFPLLMNINIIDKLKTNNDIPNYYNSGNVKEDNLKQNKKESNDFNKIYNGVCSYNINLDKINININKNMNNYYFTDPKQVDNLNDNKNLKDSSNELDIDKVFSILEKKENQSKKDFPIITNNICNICKITNENIDDNRIKSFNKYMDFMDNLKNYFLEESNFEKNDNIFDKENCGFDFLTIKNKTYLKLIKSFVKEIENELIEDPLVKKSIELQQNKLKKEYLTVDSITKNYIDDNSKNNSNNSKKKFSEFDYNNYEEDHNNTYRFSFEKYPSFNKRQNEYYNYQNENINNDTVFKNKNKNISKTFKKKKKKYN